MDKNASEEQSALPVPKPRRHVSGDINLNNSQTSYENVAIDLINKKINIKDENLQNNAKSKLETNKLFLMPSTSNINEELATSVQKSVQMNDLQNISNNNYRNLSKQLDEINKLSNIYNDDENVTAKPVPVPAPRRSTASMPANKIENSLHAGNKSSCSSSTGAISKQSIVKNNNATRDLSPKKEKVKNGSKNTGSYSFVSDECDSGSSDNIPAKFTLKKTFSSSSIDSSQSGASNNDSSHGQKYQTSSPAQLLKALGATSKMLTESITERVTTRTQGAKHKIDKMHKLSRERISETTKTATNKLKTVRKNIHDTIELTQNSLARKKTSSTTKIDATNTEKPTSAFHLDRPQTVPVNDELFSTISFNSPLNSKTNKCMNINQAESSYEIPKSVRSISSDSSSLSENALNTKPAKVAPLNLPPSYDEVMKDISGKIVVAESSKSDNLAKPPNPTARNRRRNKADSNSYENHEIIVPPKKAENNERKTANSSEEDDVEFSAPCPSFPAPVLKEGIYGKIRTKTEDEIDSTDAAETSSSSLQPPTRQRRRKDYEQAEILKNSEDLSSNRATAGSNVLDGKYSKLLPQELSDELNEKLKLKESNADRSDSWVYTTAYDDDDDESSDNAPSSPEPIYENEKDIRPSTSSEPVYGVLYNEAESPDSMLTPVAIARKRRSDERLSGQYAKVNKGVKLRNETSDILKEFDPLDRKTLDKILASKSNELILLETLLSQETYGTCTDDGHADYNTSENDTELSENDESDEVPTPPERLDSLKEAADEEEVCLRYGDKNANDLNPDGRKTVIIHQNTSLRSDSIENLVEEMNNASSSNTSTTTNDESAKKPSNTRWFFGSSSADDSKAKSKADSKSSKKTKEEKLPTYNEAVGINDESKTEITEKPLPPLSKTSSMKSMFSNVLNKVEGIKRKTSFRSAPSKPEVKTVLEMIPRPTITQRLTLHEGHLIRLPTGVVEDILKELHSRKAYIRDKKFQAYCDKDTKTPKENIPLEWITTIQCVNNHKFSNNFVDIYCFELTTSVTKNMGSSLSNPNMIITSNNSGNTKMQRVCHLYGVAKESERFIWMQKLLESLTDVFPPGFSCRFYRAGWCYSKNSITSTWSGTWVLLQKEKRRLLFYNYLNMNLECMDLRKARCMVLKESDDSIKNLHVESGPTLMIDCPPYTMYFIMTSPRETKIWRHIIQEVAHNNGPSLKEQQLTKDNVPVLVDKCINFIYTHGSMSEGIYRKSGSENSIQKLLKKFRSDAYSAQIIRSEYNEHDVANALKRFMRDLPDRLLGRYTISLVSVSKMKEIRDKIEAYKELLTRLPSIEYHTLRKLLGHLHFIQTQKARNKMDYANLGIVWGPTLLQDEQNDSHSTYSQSSCDVVIDLIKYYKNLYALSAEEISKEQLMLAVLQKYHAAAENLTDSAKKSGDLKVWITIDANPDNETEEKQQVNVTLTPNKTVNDICKELAPKIHREAFDVTLDEIILNDTLQRPLHHSEKVFDVVLKWSYWPEADRKNNYLRLRPMKFMKEIERALRALPSIIPNKELKFADAKTKSLKSYTLELADSKITVMKKDKNTIAKIKEIDLQQTTAYLGCEKKRDFQLRWAITLIENDQANKTNLRTRETPYIGHVIAGTNSNDQIVWYASILHSLYRDNIMPNPEIILP